MCLSPDTLSMLFQYLFKQKNEAKDLQPCLVFVCLYANF